MTSKHRFSGVLSPVVTPFGESLDPEPGKLARQCSWLISQGVGLAVFGTNSEANSLSVDEKLMLLDHLVDSGIPGERLMPGTGCCALSDSVRLTAHATTLGCGGVLMLPPFYYKGADDDALYRSYAEIIQRVGDDKLKIYLYHIPQVSNVPITLTLIEKLVKDFPDTVVGIKDSSGDWSNTKAMLDSFPGFGVFAGSETFLLQNMRNGGAGCISATANINPGAIHALYETWRNDDADDQQARLDTVRGVFEGFPMIPAMKAAIAHFAGDAVWKNVRPPLMNLPDDATNKLLAELDRISFKIEGV